MGRKERDTYIMPLVDTGASIRLTVPKRLAEKLGWTNKDYVTLRCEGKRLVAEKIRVVKEEVSAT